MAKQTINIGSAANDGTGSTLRAAFDITNDNFTELYDGSGGLLHKIEGTNFTGSLLIGHSTTGTLSSASNNTGIGIGALDALTSGDDNVAVGKAAGGAITTGGSNIAIGRNAGDAITTGSFNIAVGAYALTVEDEGNKNTAIGYAALENLNNDGDTYNVAIGHNAGKQVTSGVQNTLVGGLAADALNTGTGNVAVGWASLSSETSGNRNTAVGWKSLQQLNNTGTAYNTALGYEAGLNVSTGTQNVMLGGLAGDALTSGSNNIIIGYNAAASAVDVSNEVTIGNSSIANVRIPSDSTLKIGASGDLQLEHVSSNSFIKNTAVGNLYIENQVDDADIIFRCDDGSGGLDTYFSIDGGQEKTTFSKNTEHQDSVKAQFGNSGDFGIFHNGTNTFLENDTGDLYIRNNSDDKDIIFQSDDGSGGVTEYFRLDGSNAGFTTFPDSTHLAIGTDRDFRMSHDGTDTNVWGVTGDIIFTNYADDKDIVFRSDDGSGGVAEYFRLNGDNTDVIFSKSIELEDNVELRIGSSGADLRMLHNGTNSFIQNYTGDLEIQQEAADKDILFRCDDGSGGLATYFFLDGSAAGGGYIYTIFPDQSAASFGDGIDLNIFHYTHSYVSNDTGDLIIRNNADDKDIVFQCDDGSGSLAEYFKLDGSEVRCLFSVNAEFSDNVKAKFGTSDDLQIYHNATNSLIENSTGDFYISNKHDDGDIIFFCDDGSGGTTEYFRVDGGDTRIKFSKNSVHTDNVKALFGDSLDLEIYHDATDSFIVNATGHLYIKNDSDDKSIYLQTDNASGGTTTYVKVDGLSNYTEFPVAARFMDSVQLQFGNSGDGYIKHTGTDMTIENSYDDGDLNFKSDNGSGGVTEYFWLDGGIVKTRFAKEATFADSVPLTFGNVTTPDLSIQHNGTDSQITNTTGHLQFTNVADDKDITFASDNGSGGDTVYLTLDGGDVSTIVHTVKVLMPNLPTSDPSVAGQLYTDSGVLKVSAG